MQKQIKSKQKIRILHVIGYMDMGGAETFLMNILRTLDSDKYDFTFLCFTDRSFDYEPELKELGARIIRIPGIKKGGVFKNIRRMVGIMREEKIDVVHSHIFYDSVFSLFAAVLAGVRMRVNHSHNTKFENNPSIIKRGYFLAAGILSNIFSNYRLACSEEAGKALFGDCYKFEVLYNGIEVRKFHFDSDARREVREGLGIDRNSKLILHVGRFDKQKNHEFLIDVFKLYAKRNPTAKLVLIGDGPLRPFIVKKARAYGLESSIFFLGKRADVARYYSASDVFIFPSEYEGLGMVLVEAQSNGLPAVASTEVPVAVDLTGRVSFLSLETSLDSWVKELEAVTMDAHGRTRNYDQELAHYDARTVRDSLVKLYDKVLA